MATTLTRPAVAAAGSGGASFDSISGAGFLTLNKGVPRVQPVLDGPGVEMRNHDAVGGKLQIGATNQKLFFSAKRVPLHVAAELEMKMICKGARLFVPTHIYFVNFTGAPNAAFRAGLFTLPAGGGDNLIPVGRSFVGPIDDIYSTLRVPVPDSLQVCRSLPFAYFKALTVNPVALYADLYVQGDVLEWELKV